MSVNRELQKSVQSALIELFVIDLNPIGINEIFYLTPTPDAAVDRRNLLNFSEVANNNAWLKVNTVIVSDSAVAPDGTMTADRIREVATTPGSPFFYITQTALGQTGGTYTFSCYLKAQERTFANLRFDDGAASNTVQCSIDLTTGQTLNVGGNAVVSNISSVATDVGNGWWRFAITATWTTLTGVRVFVRPALGITNITTQLGYLGDPTQGFLAWGMQLEKGQLTDYQRVEATSHQPYPDAIRYNGNTYIAFPIQAEGFETNTDGSPPQPTLRVSNVTKYIQSYLGLYQDLVGAKVTRTLTFESLLSTPNEVFGQQVFIIQQLASQTKEQIEFKLCSVLDNKRVKLPREQVLRTEFPGAGLFRG